MKYRNSSRNSMHLLNGAMVGGDDAWANGVEIYPSASGSRPVVTAVADETTKALRITGKADGVLIGNSSGVVFKGAYTATSTWSNAALSSGEILELSIASTTADVNPGDLVSFDGDFFAAGAGRTVIWGGHRLSTVNASRVTISMAVPGSSACSTLSGTVRVTWLDLT